MGKENGKKVKTKRRTTGPPNAAIKKMKGPAFSTAPTNPVPPAPSTEADETKIDRGAAQDKEKEMEKTKRLAGFIFMCNPNTKLECYRYRVFGLPSGKKEVVEEIKPGTKLFLFDFELKLLYGIYEATSTGKLNLEPTAFRGKFPAQVKFKIFKECLPLPESSLRHVIQENYAGSKFKQELTGKQVRKLISSFRPLTGSSSSSFSQPTPQAHVSVSRAMPHSAMVHQFKHTVPPPAMEVPYIYGRQYSSVPTLVQPQPVVPKANYLQHRYHNRTAAAYMEPQQHMNPNLGHQSLPGTSSYYVADPQRSSFTAYGVEEPPYSRYRVTDERPPREQVPVSERQYNHHYQLPPQRESLYQDNNIAAAYNKPLYTSSVSQPNVNSPYYQLPLQTSSQYQGSAAAAYSSNLSAAAYSSNLSAAAAQYSAPASAQYASAPAYYQLPSQGENVGPYSSSSYVAAGSAQYASSAAAMLPQVVAAAAAAPPVYSSSQASAPISAYYSYNAPNWPTR
ncbi:hypothetical protein ABFS82_09G077500 [Erythranthe guttata]|uniref:uncharacterized protein LOC105976034 n=1 Tax=Erythranthe guttata TaxID=4155 RepID=UPI00064D96B2|nr:PREDICTED: uncharacterized protein LOC105976034 [Erythranthe guttata]XP_012856768.1 PREDICTED: uncharacterized protein LOC105976034 [Erythranthe guttata]|eukprot:XP_012856767.1 PREDICTED: uncharacterized protein LOC105976034 [Erythranthe guttata]